VACGNVGSPRLAARSATAARRAAGWKRERVSESERHGIVKYNSAALLTRRGQSPCGWWGLLMGLSTVNNKPAGLSSRTPSPARVIIPELGQATARSISGSSCPPTRRSTESQPAGVRSPRIVDQAKARGNARDTGGVPGCRTTELNSTTAAEVKKPAKDGGHARKAC
jgi:hypothetical protein